MLCYINLASHVPLALWRLLRIRPEGSNGSVSPPRTPTSLLTGRSSCPYRRPNPQSVYAPSSPPRVLRWWLLIPPRTLRCVVALLLPLSTTWRRPARSSRRRWRCVQRPACATTIQRLDWDCSPLVRCTARPAPTLKTCPQRRCRTATCCTRRDRPAYRWACAAPRRGLGIEWTGCRASTLWPRYALFAVVCDATMTSAFVSCPLHYWPVSATYPPQSPSANVSILALASSVIAP